jgi:DNA modification methylase
MQKLNSHDLDPRKAAFAAKPLPTTTNGHISKAKSILPDQERLVGLNGELTKIALKNTSAQLQFGVMTGEVLTALRSLPSDTFNVVITSPPYFWVRDYEVEGQIGHEETVEQYVAKLGEVFNEVKRVMHPKGVFYLNIGDTYYSGNGQPHGTDPRCSSRNFMRKKMRPVDRSGWDIPKKSLIGIPWKVAFHLQSLGWTLRSDIIWRRSNAFSEPSARDRPWRQHEHLFLFSKSRFYSYITEPLEGEGDVWNIRIERAKMVEHNAAFPKKLVRRCILTGSPTGGKVLDPFLGSGTTLLTALELGRHGVGIDLKPEYTSGVVRAMRAKHCENQSWSELDEMLKTETTAGDWDNVKDLP